jgi:tetratricopeptide (TPR) repeat protein
LGTAYRDQYARTGSEDNLDIAIHFFQQALDISREIGDRRTEANLYANLGTAYREQYARTGSEDNLDIAIHFFQQALDISREIGDRRTEANLYANLGTAYRDQYARTGSEDNLDIAIHFFHRALEFFGVETYPVEYATIQNNLANTYVLLNRGDKAENIERAIAHYREALRVHPPDSPFVASSLHNLGVVLSEHAQVLGDRKEYAQAIEVLQQSLAQTPPASPDWLRVASSLIKVYVEVGNWRKAKSLSSNVLARTGTDFSSLETLLPWYQGLGDLAIQNQDPEFAARVFAEAIHRFEIQSKKVPDTLNNRLLELREQLGDDRFVLIWAEVQGVLTPVLAQKMHEARQLMSQEQFGEAVNRFSDALSLLGEMELTKECKRQRATILFLRGFCLRKQGLWEEALQDQDQSFQLFEELRDYVGEAHTFLEIGHLFEVMNNYEDARLHYIDAYRLYRRAENKHGMALASENLGRLEYRVRMLSQAVQDLEEARRLYISIGDRTKAATIDSDLDAARASLVYQAANNNKQGDNK